MTYIYQTGYQKTLAPENSGVTVYLPSLESVNKKPSVNIEFVGEKPKVDSSVKILSELIGKLYSGTKTIEIDWLLHRIIQGKNVKKQVSSSHLPLSLS